MKRSLQIMAVKGVKALVAGGVVLVGAVQAQAHGGGGHLGGGGSHFSGGNFSSSRAAVAHSSNFAPVTQAHLPNTSFNKFPTNVGSTLGTAKSPIFNTSGIGNTGIAGSGIAKLPPNLGSTLGTNKSPIFSGNGIAKLPPNIGSTLGNTGSSLTGNGIAKLPPGIGTNLGNVGSIGGIVNKPVFPVGGGSGSGTPPSGGSGTPPSGGSGMPSGGSGMPCPSGSCGPWGGYGGLYPWGLGMGGFGLGGYGLGGYGLGGYGSGGYGYGGYAGGGYATATPVGSAPVAALPVAPAATVAGVPANTATVDLALADLQQVSAGDASQGPLFRVSVINNTNVAVSQAFDVQLVATNGEAPNAQSITGTQRVMGIGAGQTLSVDVRLPASANTLHQTASGQSSPFTTLFVGVDAQSEVQETTKTNNVARIDRAQSPSSAQAATTMVSTGN